MILKGGKFLQHDRNFQSEKYIYKEYFLLCITNGIIISNIRKDVENYNAIFADRVNFTHILHKNEMHFNQRNFQTVKREKNIQCIFFHVNNRIISNIVKYVVKTTIVKNYCRRANFTHCKEKKKFILTKEYII